MMTKTNDLRTRRMMALLVLAMVAVLVLCAPMAEAKKHRHKNHHHHRPPASASTPAPAPPAPAPAPAPAPSPAPALNVVQCPNQSNNTEDCFGTAGNDYLVGTEAFDHIEGKEGDDVYDGKGGDDSLIDDSATSNDYYLLPATEFGPDVQIIDEGGSFDVLDLSAYKPTDFGFSRSPSGQSLRMNGPRNRGIQIEFFFTRNSIDFFKFSDGTLTADQVKSRV